MAQPLSELLKRIDDIPDGFSDNIKSYERVLLDHVSDLIELLERDASGKILLTNSNLSKIDEISSGIRNFMFNGEYAEMVGSFANEFNIQKSLTNDYFKETFESFVPKNLYDDAYKIAVNKQLALYNAGSINQVFVNSLIGNIEAAVTGGQSLKDLRTSISNYIKGERELEGQLSRYVKQTAKDAFSVANRTYVQVISTDLGVEFYKYLGGLIKDSRCFCIERADKFYHRKEIENWGAKKDLGICRTESSGIIRWDGMYRGTNPNTIFNFVGGYGCNHVIIPVSIFSVPIESINRAIKGGYYKPDKKTRELLGI